MEIKILTMDEMPQAVNLARGVFNYCLRNTLQHPQYIAMFENYTNVQNIGTMMQQGELILWGIYEQGHLVAMSGMQREGHITMIYVLPVYQRRGYGKELLLAMRTYAGSCCGLPGVTLNAMPAWTAAYFRHRRFQAFGAPQPNVPFVYMQARSIVEVSYDHKKIPTGWMVGTALGGLGICIVIAAAFMVSYLL